MSRTLKKEKEKTLSTRVDSETYEMYREEAEDLGISVSQFVNDAAYFYFYCLENEEDNEDIADILDDVFGEEDGEDEEEEEEEEE